MIRAILRSTSSNYFPHSWFEAEHPMLRADPKLVKMMKYRELKGKIPEKPERIISTEEYNSDLVDLYELTKEDYMLDPPVMEMFIKLYSNYNPEKIIQDTQSLPSFNFNASLQKITKFDYNYTHSEMENIKKLDCRYFISRFCPPGFRLLIDTVLQKLPIYGIVVPMDENEQYQELSAALDKQIFIFFFGEGVFFDDYERSLFRKVLLAQVTEEKFLDNRQVPFVTEAEDNFMIGMINWAASDDHEYRTMYRPYFREYDLEKEYWQFPPKSIYASIHRRVWYRFYYK
jgi:hypothetical protein